MATISLEPVTMSCEKYLLQRLECGATQVDNKAPCLQDDRLQHMEREQAKQLLKKAFFPKYFTRYGGTNTQGS